MRCDQQKANPIAYYNHVVKAYSSNQNERTSLIA